MDYKLLPYDDTAQRRVKKLLPQLNAAQRRILLAYGQDMRHPLHPGGYPVSVPAAQPGGLRGRTGPPQRPEIRGQ